MQQAVIKKLDKRLLPFLMLLFFVAILDRVNIGIASLQMNAELGFTAQIFGLGAGIFFIGYFIFEVPSNLILEKVGARRWIARIMITWGIISVLMMFVSNPTTFYILRFLLGAAEAGFYPGIIFYITTFYPAQYRTKALAIFQIGSPIAVALGSPITGLILGLDGTWGLSGWQLVFLLEGIPAVILGIVCIYYLTDSPEKAKWLTIDEKKWLSSQLLLENKGKEHLSLLKLFTKPQVWLQSFVYLSIVVGLYGVTFWLPQIISQSSGQSDLAVSFLSSIPSIVSIFAIFFVAKYSEKTGKQKLFAAVSCFIGAMALISSSYIDQPYIALFALAIAAAGIQAAIPPFWTFPSAMFTGAAAAGAIATINSIGNLGGFVGPNVVGYLSETTGNLQTGLLFLGIVLSAAGIGVLFLKKQKNENINADYKESKGSLGA